MSERITVAAALIRREERLLVTRRPDNVHLGGLWEFPGGKVLGGESLQDGLTREIREELGIEIAVGTLYFERTYEYPDRTVHLHFFDCRILGGSPSPEGVAAWKWVRPADLDSLRFPEANGPLLEMLKREKGPPGDFPATKPSVYK